MKLRFLILAFLLHLGLILLFCISWQHIRHSTIHETNLPTVWLANSISSRNRFQPQLHLNETHLKSSQIHSRQIFHTQTKSQMQQNYTALPQPAVTNNNLIKILHDQIAAELMQNINRSGRSLNGNVSLLIDFDLDSQGGIDQITVQPAQTPTWLKNLVLNSIQAISPIQPSTTTILIKSHYEIPITLELSQ